MKEQIKLELIKLTHRFDRHPDECVKHAKIYEEYVLGSVKNELENIQVEERVAEKVVATKFGNFFTDKKTKK